MLIERVNLIETTDQARFAWSGLSRYHNLPYTEKAIDRLHNLNGSHKANVRKQSEQIRYCLIQALEYRKAAEVVGLATKPLLYYYSAMSLALAQILMKGSGDVSLDRARGKNAHHGLTLRGAEEASRSLDFSSCADTIGAVPLSHADGRRFGTFELWHQSARDLPDVGKVTRKLSPRGVSETFEVIGSALDERSPLVPKSGLSLLHCYKRLPQMKEFLRQQGIDSSAVKCNLSMEADDIKKTTSLKMIIQPAAKTALNDVYEGIKFVQYRESTTDIHDFGDGCSITVKTNEFQSEEFETPSTIQTNSKHLYMCPGIDSLNEFGIFYFTLYILGNYARYFPDQWMRDVENYSPMALAADELLGHADHRLPLLTLCEMDRCVILSR